MTITSLAAVGGAILAGGQGSRMGGEDKGLLLYHGLPLYQHVLQCLKPQVADICINANRNLPLYRQSGLRVIPDQSADFLGPLAGMLAILQQDAYEWTVFAPCDMPHLPVNYAMHLWSNRENMPVVWARTETQDHPTIALVHSSVKKELVDYLDAGERKIKKFFQQIGGKAVRFEKQEHAFININTPEGLVR
ncbi:MAG: Molybdenum cofactor guanylyltransferase [Candidatus Erwinia impunctatus]|nr:Molybdenum cofactor guanylyltransferase [Culicoides impunctatus]